MGQEHSTLPRRVKSSTDPKRTFVVTRLRGFPANPLDKLCDRHVQGTGELHQYCVTWLSPAALEMANCGPVDSGELCKFSLAQSGTVTEPSEVLAELVSHAPVFGRVRKRVSHGMREATGEPRIGVVWARIALPLALATHASRRPSS